MQFESHFNLQQIKEPKFIVAIIILRRKSDRVLSLLFTKRVQIFASGSIGQDNKKEWFRKSWPITLTPQLSQGNFAIKFKV